MGNAQGATNEDTSGNDQTVVQELRDRHNELKRQLDLLKRHISLTPAEQLESARLKKEKLAIKDRIAALGGQV